MFDCELKDDRLYYRGRMYIPDSENLRLHLITKAHSYPSGGHGGKSCNFELLSRHYYCPGLARLVRQFMRNCEKCSRAKAANKKYKGLLHPLPVRDSQWKEDTSDFVIGVPQVGEFNAICVFID